MKRPISALRRDNRGSGIVTVLVAMLFIAALGATTLFLSYTGLQIKISERKSKENFYSADAAMQQIRTGVEQAVSESLKTAYDNILEGYSGYNTDYQNLVKNGSGLTLNDYMTSQFKTEFQNDLLGWTDSGGDSLFAEQGGDRYAYSPAVLLGFLNLDGAQKTADESTKTYRLTRDGLTVDLECGDSTVTIAYKNDRTPSSLTLNGITLAYTAASGYRTDITTGITISYPPFSYSPAAYSVADVSKCATIAKNALTCTFRDLTLTGDAYAGTISVDNGATLAHTQGTLVSAGDVSADNGATFSDSSSLWAKSITVVSGAKADLTGDTYVADDLILAGEKAAAALSGRYDGFGYSFTDASNSSSILVNGRRTSLDLHGLASLTLAGNSFIDSTGADEGAGKYIMGQSVAARSDQLAYLVPASCLPDGISSNPSIVTSAIDDSLLNGNDPNSVMSRVKTLAAANPCFQYVDGVQAVYVHLNSTGSGAAAAYLFFTFRQNGSESPQDRANRYFSLYYSAHSADIDVYLTKYLSYYRASPHALSGGNTYAGSVTDGTPSGDGLEGPSANPLAGSATQAMTRYTNLCRTMSEGVSAAEGTSPYEYVVNTAEVANLPDGTTEFKDPSGAVAAVIVKNAPEAYKIDGDTPQSLKIVITAGTADTPGDVSVEREFNGLIVSDGTVDMQAPLHSGVDVSAALQAMDGGGRTLLSFLKIGSKTEGGAAGGSAGTSWDAGSLVGYSGWQKH